MDYVNSIQELNIARAHQKLLSSQRLQDSSVAQATTTQQLPYVEQFKCRLRQAENRPQNRHELDPALIRGFECFNADETIMLKNSIVRHPNSTYANSTHLFQLMYSGVTMAGIPVCKKLIEPNSQQNTQSKTRPKRVSYQDLLRQQKYRFDQLKMQFYLRYYQKIDFQIQCDLQAITNEMQGLGLNYSRIEPEYSEPQYGELKFNKSEAVENLQCKPEHHSLVHQQRLSQLIQ